MNLKENKYIQMFSYALALGLIFKVIEYLIWGSSNEERE